MLYQCKYCSKTSKYPRGSMACKKSPTGAHLWEEVQAWKGVPALVVLSLIVVYSVVLVVGPVKALAAALRVGGAYEYAIMGVAIFGTIFVHRRIVAKQNSIPSRVTLWVFVAIEVGIVMNFTAFVVSNYHIISWRDLISNVAVLPVTQYYHIICLAVAAWLGLSVIVIVLHSSIKVFRSVPAWIWLVAAAVGIALYIYYNPRVLSYLN